VIERWRRLSPGGRAAAIVVTVLVGVHLVTTVLDGAIGGGPRGAPGSSLATAPRGVSAWATLLEDVGGHEVRRLRVPLDRATVDVGSTVVLVDPASLEVFEDEALASFVHAGGTAVVGGVNTEPVIDQLLGGVDWAPGGVETADVVADAPEVGEAVRIRASAQGHWRLERWADVTVAVAGGDVPIVVLGNLGAGRVVALADVSPFTNERLAEADNAALALAVVGDAERPVVFAEAAHGHGDSGLGLDDLPDGWATTVIGLALVGVALLWSRGRRFGPPNEEDEDPVPPRRAYVDAIAATTARGSAVGEDPVAPLRRRARAQLARRAGVDGGVSDAELRLAAARAGVDDRIVHGVLDGSVIETGVAAARLEVG